MEVAVLRCSVSMAHDVAVSACMSRAWLRGDSESVAQQDTVGVDTERLEAVQLKLLRLHEARPRGVHGISLDGGSASAAEREAAGQVRLTVVITSHVTCLPVSVHHTSEGCSTGQVEMAESVALQQWQALHAKHTECLWFCCRQCGTPLAKRWNVCCMIWMLM